MWRPLLIPKNIPIYIPILPSIPPSRPTTLLHLDLLTFRNIPISISMFHRNVRDTLKGDASMQTFSHSQIFQYSHDYPLLSISIPWAIPSRPMLVRGDCFPFINVPISPPQTHPQKPQWAYLNVQHACLGSATALKQRTHKTRLKFSQACQTIMNGTCVEVNVITFPFRPLVYTCISN